MKVRRERCETITRENREYVPEIFRFSLSGGFSKKFLDKRVITLNTFMHFLF